MSYQIRNLRTCLKFIKAYSDLPMHSKMPLFKEYVVEGKEGLQARAYCRARRQISLLISTEFE